MQISAAITEKSLLFNIFKKYTWQFLKHYIYTHVSMVNDYDKHH